MKTAGYSGTPLAKKLGIKNGFIIKLVNEPDDYFDLFSDFPEEIQVETGEVVKKDFIHFFTTSIKSLSKEMTILKPQLKQDGALWVSWPKQSARMETDLNGNIVRAIGLEMGLVDIKVCAVNEVWSGLKFVIPVKDRKLAT